MNLPKEITTVTPLSRNIALLMLIAMPVIGFLLGMKYQNTITEIKNVPVISSALTPTPSIKTRISNWTPYSNRELGISFYYPKKLKLTEKDNIITLIHSVPYENTGGCDLSGGPVRTYDNLTDFKLTFEINPSLIEPEIFEGRYQTEDLKGTWYTSGAEGCGEYVYNFKTNSNNTLIVKKEIVQAFSGISTNWDVNEILKIPGIINKEESDEIFNQILSTFRFIGQNKLQSADICRKSNYQSVQKCENNFIAARPCCDQLSDILDNRGNILSSCGGVMPSWEGCNDYQQILDTIDQTNCTSFKCPLK